MVGWLGGWVVGWVVGWLGGWVAYVGLTAVGLSMFVVYEVRGADGWLTSSSYEVMETFRGNTVIVHPHTVPGRLAHLQTPLPHLHPLVYP